MPTSLEDTVTDVAAKAQRGLKISDAELAARAGLSVGELHRLQAGEADAAVLEKIAPELGLNAKALLGLPGYQPRAVQVEGLAQFSTPWTDMVVNSYLVWDAETRDAVAFDTGADSGPMLEALQSRGLSLRLILLTHTHGDHVFDLDRLREQTGARAFVSSREPFDGAEPFEEGREFQCGRLRIHPRLTWGHSPGGMTYVVEGLERPVAVVGDALFAGSMGGAHVSYPDALRTNREAIFTLAPETVLCPGHGPMTTVAEELVHNPFFAR